MPAAPLDELIGPPQFSERHCCEVRAGPARAYAAVRAVTAIEIRPLVPLMAMRTIPVAIRHPRAMVATAAAGLRSAGSRPALDQFTDAGFVELLDEPPHTYAAGAVGRFWTLSDSAPVPIDGLEGFRAFDAPGYAKAAIAFTVEAAPGGARIGTETRVVTTSADARRAFGRYWRLVGPGSALIRRSWLAAIRRRAERS